MSNLQCALVCVLSLLDAGVSFVVQLRDRAIEGDQVTNPNDGRPVLQFLGIPYAEPPLGELRFHAPVPADVWEDTREPYHRKSCLTPHNTKQDAYSEDCLYLDIWVPGRTIPGNKFVPVLVYLADDKTSAVGVSGMTLATQQNVTIVFFDHRRGSLGFTKIKGVDEIPGNQGFLDQILMLQWLQSNIHYFGGDKDRVVLFGHGSGAELASLHLTARKSAGLFHSVVVSGGASLRRDYLLDDNELELNTHQLAQSVDCEPSDIKCLQSVDAKALVSQTLQFGPFLDDRVIGGVPEELLARRNMNAKRVMIGTTENAGFPFVAEALPADFPRRDWSSKTGFITTDLQHLECSKKLLPPEYADDKLAQMLIHHEYARWSHGTPAKRQISLEKLFADYSVTCPGVELAKLCAKGGCDTYMYRFGTKLAVEETPEWMGSSQGADIPYFFGVPLASDAFSKKEKQLSKAMMLYLGNFMRTGNPNYGPAGMRPKAEWPEYQLPGKKHLSIDNKSIKTGSGLREQFCHFWKYYLQAVLSLADGTYNEPKFSEKEMYNEETTEHQKYTGDGKASACPFH